MPAELVRRDRLDPASSHRSLVVRRRFEGSMGVPTSVVNTRPLLRPRGAHLEPFLLLAGGMRPERRQDGCREVHESSTASSSSRRAVAVRVVLEGTRDRESAALEVQIFLPFEISGSGPCSRPLQSAAGSGVSRPVERLALPRSES